MDDLEQTANPRIFREAALRKFLGDALLEINPTLTIAKTTQLYFAQIFTEYLLEKNCFEFWKVRNDRVEFEGWPESLKMDHFMEQCWNKNYDNELTFLYR